MYSFPNLEPVRGSTSSSDCGFLTCKQISQEAGQVVWCFHLLKNFPQFIVIHTVKDFRVVNEAEVDDFSGILLLYLWSSRSGNLISGSSAFPSGASLVAQKLKRLPARWETRVQPLGQEDPLEKETAPHSSILAWRLPWTEEPGRLQSMGSQRVRHDWATSLSLSSAFSKSSLNSFREATFYLLPIWGMSSLSFFLSSFLLSFFLTLLLLTRALSPMLSKNFLPFY